jgi:hypothetical protein
MKKILLIFLLSYFAIQSMGQVVINPKGTKVTIDSSKWKLTGNDIFFKNSGNVGIGTSAPTAQLHTTNSVRFQGIGTNTIDTKILTTDSLGNLTTRLLSSLPTNADSTAANNGLTLSGKNIQLGGNLIQPTVISNNEKPLTFATGGFPLNITGLTAGAATDSLVTVNTTTGKINRINLATINKADSTTSSNGLNLVGKDVRLGGNLTQATTITNNANPLTIATGGTALNITGLTAGAATDSLVTVNTTTGKINRINLATINKADSTTSSNGLNLVGKDVRLGGNLTQATTITNNANPLTIATGGTALNITGLTAGATTDSLVTVNTATGKINRINLATINKADSTTSNNGLTLTGKNVQLGGNLIQATTITNNANPLTIATGGTALNITGLTAGAATDSLVTVNTTTGKINRINLATINKADSTTSSNGLNLVGKDVRLGGNLTQATTITNNANPLTIATGGTALNITGLTAGATTDSLVTVNTATGKINRINLATINKADSTTSSNGLNLVGKDVRLGGNLTQATIITNNANPLTIATGGTALNITGLTAGATTDSLVTVNTTTGKINRINLATINKADSTTSSNGLNLVGKDVRLGGNLTQATIITNNANPLTIATGGTALNITGLTAGATTDSLVTVNTTTGKINRINLATINKADSTTSSNGLNLVGKDVRLGGNLTQATTITNNANPLTIATGGTALSITGLTAGAATDSLVTVNTTTGKINRINLATINKADSTTANNGLTLTGKNVQLGGNLIQATTITNNANPLTIATGGTALNITGLTAGATTDSLVTVNTATGKINRINLATINKADSTTSNNGLTLTGKNVQLGGNLIQSTTITNNSNPLTIATGGTALNITGLPSGASTDSLVVINNATGQLRKIQAVDVQPRLVEIYDVAGTQALSNVFTNLNLGTTTIADAGFVTASGVITVANAGLYRITFRATVRVTNNVASGGEFQLTNAGVAIPGSLGYTFQQNNNRQQGTVTVVKVVNLIAGSTIAVQGRRYSTAGNLTLTANGSSLLIEKIR